MNKLVTKLNVESQSFQVRCILNQRKVVAIIFSKDLPASSKDFPKLVNTTAGSGPLWVAKAELGKDLGKELGNDLVCADGPTSSQTRGWLRRSVVKRSPDRSMCSSSNCG
jgi:hypothetical protein